MKDHIYNQMIIEILTKIILCVPSKKDTNLSTKIFHNEYKSPLDKEVISGQNTPINYIHISFQILIQLVI